MELFLWFYCFIMIVAVVDNAHGACNLPESWQNKSWYLYRGPDETRTRSASKRLMNCTVTEVYGLQVDTLTVVQDKWECFLTEGDIVALKGNKIGDYIGTDMYIYAAFKVNNLFAWPILYPLTSADVDAYDEHVIRIQITVTPQMSQIATLSQPPEGVWYFMFQTGVSPMPNKYLEVKTTNNPTISTAPSTTITTTMTTEKTTTPTTPVITESTFAQPSESLSACMVAATVCTCFGICIVGLILVFIVLQLRKNKKHRPDTPKTRPYYHYYEKYHGPRNFQTTENIYDTIGNPVFY